jgi:hypothetical protein
VYVCVCVCVCVYVCVCMYIYMYTHTYYLQARTIEIGTDNVQMQQLQRRNSVITNSESFTAIISPRTHNLHPVTTHVCFANGCDDMRGHTVHMLN